MIKQSQIFFQKYAVLIIAFASLFLFGISDNIRGPLFSEVLYTFGIHDGEGSWFFSVSSAAGIIGAYTAAWWISRIGEMRALQFSVFLIFSAQILVSFATSFSNLLVFKTIFGFGLGLLGVTQNYLVVQGSPEKYKNKILSALHCMYAASSLLAPLLINFLISIWHTNGFGGVNAVELWRRVFQATALCSLALLLFTFQRRHWDIPVLRQSSSSQAEGKESFFKRLYFAVALSCYVGAEVLIATRIALYMRREYAATLAESSWYTAIFFVCLLAGRTLFAFWTPKLSSHRQLIMSLLLSVIMIVLGLMFHPIFLAISGFSMAPFYPLMMVWAGEIFSKSLASAISLGVSFSSFFVVGMHVFLGMVSESPGIRYGFMIGPVLCLVSIGMLLAYEKIFRRLQS